MTQEMVNLDEMFQGHLERICILLLLDGLDSVV
jgi:hypothetical protein